MRQMILMLACLPTTALAQDWQPLGAASLKAALAARTVAYDGGATQQFNADGTTIYTTANPSFGKWRVEGAQYCSAWPPFDHWACYTVARSDNGLDLRFTAADGSASVGRYVDLK